MTRVQSEAEHVLDAIFSPINVTWMVLVCFILYLGLGCIIVYESSYVAVIAVEAPLTGIALVFAASTWWYSPTSPSQQAQVYSKPLRYTIISSILAMGLGLGLYPGRWYPGLTTNSLELRSVAQSSMPLPAVAVISIPFRRDFANLTTDKPPKCFLADWAGGFNDDESMCNNIPLAQVLDHPNCNCVDMWSPVIQDGLVDSYYASVPYQVLQPTSKLMVSTVSTTLVLQVSSTFNSSRTLIGDEVPAPALSILLYDRTIAPEDAFKQDYGTRITIDAHGTTTLSVTPEYKIGFSRDPYYQYPISSAGSRSSLNMTCDVAKPQDYTNPCYFTLNIHLATMNRLEVSQQKSMSPADVFVEFSSYYALFQFLAWVISGMALSST